jgi:hypothetical protein
VNILEFLGASALGGAVVLAILWTLNGVVIVPGSTFFEEDDDEEDGPDAPAEI